MSLMFHLRFAGRAGVETTRRVPSGRSILWVILFLFLYSQGHAGPIAKNQEGLNAPTLRVAVFNAYLNRDKEGGLVEDLRSGNDEQAKKVAAIIQRVNPDILLINEFDYVPENAAISLFQKLYLERPQFGGEPIDFPYVFLSPSNTGVPSDFDLDHDGNQSGSGADAWGYGLFPGQYGMVVLSKYPIEFESARTFQSFLWRDMPEARLPIDPINNRPWYSSKVLAEFPLSSKSHWDIPVKVRGETIHVLASHPTPPTFDGEEDRNGSRNHDEIRFWADYLDPQKSDYIYDDAGIHGGLADGQRFVILGDLNASVGEGKATGNPMQLLLDHPRVDSQFVPSSQGASENAPDNPLAPFHTAEWKLRVDYVLPSKDGISTLGGGVFWPTPSDKDYFLVGPEVQSSDHRLVYLDLRIDSP